MKKHSILCAMALILIMALAPAAYAAAPRDRKSVV